LRISLLVGRGVGHGEARAINDLDRATAPEPLARGVGLHAITDVTVDALELGLE
jgi:hypothetical protein